MKKLKNKGFTIIELLTVILILALIVAMVVPSYNAIIKKNKAKIYDSKKNMIILAAEKYATDENLSGINTISVNKLIEEGYIAGEKDEDGNYNIINDVNNENMRCYTITIDATSELPEAALNEKANCEFVESEIASEILQVEAFIGDTFDLDELDPTKYSVPLSKKWFNRDITVVARLVLPTLVNPGEDGYENYQTKLNYYNEFKYFGYLYDYPAPVTPGAPGYDKYQKIVAANNAVTANKDKIKVRWIGQTVAYSSGEYYSNAIGMLKVARGLETGEEAYNDIDARTNMQLLSSNGRSYKIDCKNCLYLTGSSFYQQIYTVEFINENGHILRKTFKVNIDKNPALAVASVNPNWEDGGVGCDSSNLDKCKKKVIITGSDQNGSGLFKVAVRLSGNAGPLDWRDHEVDNKYEVDLIEGRYDVYTRDNAGNESSDPADTVTVDKIDKNPPIINSLSASPSVWTKEDVTLTGNVIDDESGLKEFIFTKDNTKPATMTNIPVITDKVQDVKQVIDNSTANEGTIDWYLHTKDAVGRYTGSTTTIETKIDITNPSITFTATDETDGYNNYVKVKATCTDDLPAGKSSGVNNIVLKKIVDGTTVYTSSPNATGTEKIMLNTVGVNKIEATCTDNAGNVVQTETSNPYTLYNVSATFIANGATKIGSNALSCISYGDKDCYVPSPSIERVTWNILGWSKDENATTATYLNPGGVNSKININKNNVNKFFAITSKTAAVVYVLNGASGTNPASPQLSCTRYNTTPCNVTAPQINRLGWTLIGWNKLQNATSTTANTYAGGSSIPLSEDSTTYYAITSKAAAIVYVLNGADSILPSATTNSCTRYNTTPCSVTAPTISRSGTDVTISGWNKLQNATSTTANTYAGGSSIPLSEDSATYYAITSEKATINYDLNGADSMSSESNSCVISNASSCDLTIRTVYRGKGGAYGWSTDKNATSATYFAGNTVTLTGDNNLNLFAITYQSVSINYYQDNGDYISSDNFKIYNSNASTTYTITSTSPTKTGCTFDAWKDDWGSYYYPGNSDSMSYSFNLVAVYTCAPPPHTHEFGNSIGAASANYTNYFQQTYHWGFPGHWPCSAGHTHYVYYQYSHARRDGYYMRCIHCGQLAKDLVDAGELASNHATLWCTCGTVLEDQGCP